MTTLPPAVDALSPTPPRATAGSATVAAPGAASRAAPEPRRPEPPTPEAAEAAFKALTSSKSLEVSSFHDEGTGRYVVRVADRITGRVLIQTPPDELLRFLASAPSLDPPPTLIDA